MKDGHMDCRIKKELLQDPKVIEEINKHKWYESEKRGRDVGFEYASEDWLKKYSQLWMRQKIKRKNILSFFKSFLKSNK